MGKRGPAKGHGGRPRKSITDKLLEGNPGKRDIKIIDKNKIDAETDIDTPPKTLSIAGKEIYTRTVEYLRRMKCAEIINPMLVETFALNRQRWLEVEKQMDRGEFDKDLARISSDYQSQMRRSWNEIFAIVNDNCTENVNIDREDDLEGLLSMGGGSGV